MAAKTKARIYHNPRCTKSRETLALLREHGVEPEIVEYLKTPPDEAELRGLVKKLGGARALVRTKEAAYAALGLGPDSSDDQIVQAILREPVLLERPVVVVGARAAIGRPPEQVLALL